MHIITFDAQIVLKCTHLVNYTPHFRNIHRKLGNTAQVMHRWPTLLATASLVLLAVVQCDPITEAGATARQSVNASRILDSINKDLEEIKKTLAQAHAGRSRLVSDVSDKSSTDNKFSSQDGHYLSLDQENKDRPWVVCAAANDGDNIYKYSIPHLNQSLGLIDFSAHRGKPLLLSNIFLFFIFCR